MIKASTVGIKELMKIDTDARAHPKRATVRQPNLFVSAAAKGPIRK